MNGKPNTAILPVSGWWTAQYLCSDDQNTAIPNRSFLLGKGFLVIKGRGVVWVESRSLGTLSGAMRQAGGSSKELLCRVLSWEQSK